MKKLKTNDITLIALFSAVMCIMGPVSLYIAAIPVSVMTFVIFTVVYLLGTVKALWCVGIYIMLGIAGLPVFAGCIGGAGAIAGPTGGFILGYIPMVIFAGVLGNGKRDRKIFMTLIYIGANCVLYISGMLWYRIVADVTMLQAFIVCVAPFVIFDIAKNIASIMVGAVLRRYIIKAGIEI